ncbi:hypothetical protein LY78DRAFT_363855 [Colletotrichum sublineola]|nr:hypothetical protein LY78DRAFT_363855 [Colletotrichum sublineola]
MARTGSDPGAGEDASFGTLFGMGPIWQAQHPVPVFLDASRPSSAGELPDRTVVEEYLALFRASRFGLSFPVIDYVLFLETVDLTYQTVLTLKVVTAKSCVFAFLAIVSLFQTDWKSSPETDGEACARAAQNLMPTIL